MLDSLVVGAHPDDAESFAGGLIALCVRRGYSVGILHLTQGERATRGTVEERFAEAAGAARALGVDQDKVKILNLGDTLLENSEANRLEIVRILRDWRPRIVVHHSPRARHPDHRKSHELVNDAFFYCRVGGLDTGQPPFTPTSQLQFLNNALSREIPPFIVDISETFEQKLAAIRAYKSQFYNPEYSAPETYISSEEYYEQIEVRARFYGGLIGVRYGEAYLSDGPLPLADPIAVLASDTGSEA